MTQRSKLMRTKQILGTPVLAVLMLRYVRRWVKLIPLKSSKIGSWKKHFIYLGLHTSKNVLQIGKAKVSKSKFMHTLSKSKSIFAIEQKAIALCFVKNVAFLLGDPLISCGMKPGGCNSSWASTLKLVCKISEK